MLKIIAQAIYLKMILKPIMLCIMYASLFMAGEQFFDRVVAQPGAEKAVHIPSYIVLQLRY
jgi:hypothetical protein